MNEYILGIESSCDDTSAAVLQGTRVLSNVIASQKVHEQYGGVVPELASRAHQQNIIPVIDTSLKTAKIEKNQLSAIAFTRGPGLLGSLLVGTSFAKAFAQTLNIPMVEIDHMNAHILVHFATDDTHTEVPDFPFLCLTVSGGHTQIVVVKDYFDMEVIGKNGQNPWSALPGRSRHRQVGQSRQPQRLHLCQAPNPRLGLQLQRTEDQHLIYCPRQLET